MKGLVICFLGFAVIVMQAGYMTYQARKIASLEKDLQNLRQENKTLTNQVQTCNQSLASCERLRIDMLERYRNMQVSLRAYQNKLDRITRNPIVIKDESCEAIMDSLIEFRNRELWRDGDQ